MNTFILIGLHPQGLSMLRILSRAGHKVIAFANSKKAIGYYSKFGDKRIFSTIKELKEEISHIVDSSNEKINCIITDGEILGSILSDYPELYEICNVQSGPLALVKMLSHKNLMYEYASTRGLHCAKYELLSEYKQGDLQFPVILKRNYEIPLFFKVMKIDSERDFSVFIKKISKENYKSILVQEFINDNSLINISYQGYFINGICKCSFICSQERRLVSGITSYLKEINNVAIKNLIIENVNVFLKDSEYTGFNELEFLLSEESNSLYFIEINTRTCGLHSVLNQKFSNLSALYDNIDNPPDLVENPQFLSWINILRDIKARMQTKDFSKLSQFFTSKYDILDLGDLRPSIFQFIK